MELERAGQRQLLSPTAQVEVVGGRVVIPITLPRQGVSLLTLTW